MKEKKKFIKMLERFFSDMDEGKAWKEYNEIAEHLGYYRSKFFKLLVNPDDEWTFDIVKKGINPVLPKIIEKYGTENPKET